MMHNGTENKAVRFLVAFDVDPGCVDPDNPGTLTHIAMNNLGSALESCGFEWAGRPGEQVITRVAEDATWAETGHDGPYDTPMQAMAAPMPRAVTRLDEEGLIRPGDPHRLIRGAHLEALRAACTAAGVTLGRYDAQELGRFAHWETSAVQVLVGIIRRAATQATAGEHANERLLDDAFLHGAITRDRD